MGWILVFDMDYLCLQRLPAYQPISEISYYAKRLALSVDLSSDIFNNRAIKIQ